MTKLRGFCKLNAMPELPCTWVKEGICGADGKPCQIYRVIGDE